MRLFFSFIRWVFLPLFLFLVFSPLFASVANAADAAAFVGETYPDAHPNGYDMEANTAFTKTWTIRNSGNTIWDSRYCLRYVSNNGNLISLSQNNVCIPAGTTVRPGVNYTFSIAMRAPNVIRNGVREDWRFTNAAGTTIKVDLSNTIWVSLDVLCLINPSITVNYPNGGETWYKGKAYTITWNATPNISQLHMHLYKAGAFNRAFSNNAANDGSQAFTLTSDFPTGNDFKVGMSNVSALCDGAIADFSNNNFTIADPPAFAAPSIVSPANAAANVPLTPRLDWSDIGSDAFGPGPDAYRVQIATDVNFNNIIRDQVINGAPPSSFYDVPAGLLSNNRTYYWKVHAGNAFRGGADATARFTTDPCNLVGASLTVTTPNGGENWVRGNVYAINWNSAGTIPNVAIKLYKNGAFLSTISAGTLNDGTFNYSVPANVNAAADYKIQLSNVDAVAQCSGLVSDLSNNNFTVSNPPNFVAPGLLSPGNGASGVVRNPLLDWTDVAGATVYDVEVATDNLFNNVVASQNPGSSQWSMPNGVLNYATRYYWRAKGMDTFHDGNWSAVSTFTVQVDPTPSGTLVSENPADGTVMNPRQAFTKHWVLRNSGAINWTANFRFHHVSGSMSNSVVDVPLGVVVAPNQTFDFQVAMTAPLSGQNVQDDWQLLDAAGNVVRIGGSNTIYARINVNTPDPVVPLAEFMGENFQDGKLYTPGKAFTKTWTLRNAGNGPWGNGYLLRRKAGGANFTQAGQIAVQGNIAIGNSFVFSVNAVAPMQPGNYTEEWELVDAQGNVVPVRAPDNSWVVNRVTVVIQVEKATLPPDNMPVVDSGGVDYSAIERKILALAELHNIPPIVIEAIAFQESGWLQLWPQGTAARNYCNGESDPRTAGQPKTSINFVGNCQFSTANSNASVDVGMMQVKVNLQPSTTSIKDFKFSHDEGVKYQNVSTSWEKNLETAVGVLKTKWAQNIRGFTGCDIDSTIIENWYYPIAWYNGQGDAAYTYVGNVYDYMSNTRPMNATINNIVTEVPGIASPRLIPGFTNTIVDDPHAANETYHLADLIPLGGHIHRWTGGSNYQDITNSIGDTCEASTGNQPNAPTAVKGFKATPNGGQVTFAWNANPGNEQIQNYTVSWWALGGIPGAQSSGPIAGTSWTHAFAPGSYLAQVFASNATTDGLQTGIISFQVDAAQPGQPQAVANVRTSIAGRDITIQWNEVPDVDFYEIKWKNQTTGKSGTFTEDGGASYLADALKDGSYVFSVRACIDKFWPIPNVCGPDSAQVQSQVPDPGFAIQCTKLTNNTLVENLIISQGELKHYCFQLPPNVQVLTVQMGGEGLDDKNKDADMYLKQGSPVGLEEIVRNAVVDPATGKVTAGTPIGLIDQPHPAPVGPPAPTLIGPYLAGSLEAVTVYNPIEGKWYLAVYGSKNMAGISGNDKSFRHFIKLHFHTAGREGLASGFVLNRQGQSTIFSPVDTSQSGWYSADAKCAGTNYSNAPYDTACNPSISFDFASGTGVVPQPDNCYQKCRGDGNASKSFHIKGDWDSLDINLLRDADGGTSLVAGLSGTVVFKGKNVNAKGIGYGQEVVVQSDIDANFSTRYAHMATWDENLVVGQHIDVGQRVGTIGMTGTGNQHLHFSLHRNLALNNASGQAMDQNNLKIAFRGGMNTSDFYSAYVSPVVDDFLPVSSTTKWTTIQAQCPVSLEVVDDQDRHVGQAVSGSVSEEIPGSEYFQVHKAGETFDMISIPDDELAGAKIRVMGNADGEFNLGVSKSDDANNVYRNLSFLGEYIDETTSAEIELDHFATSYPLQISTLDGAFAPAPDYNQDNALQFINEDPTVDSVSANVLADGQRLTIRGAGFGVFGTTLPGEIDLIDGHDIYRPFIIVSWRDDEVIADFDGTLVPTDATYHLRVLVYPSRVGTNRISVDVVVPETAPVIQDARPIYAIANQNDQEAEFFGKGFDAGAELTVGGSFLSLPHVDSSGHIRGILPLVGAGQQPVVVTNGNGAASAEDVRIEFLLADGDLDNDGLSNADELAAGVDPSNPDTDGDGILDGQDAFPGDETETADADEDGIGDNLDRDDDNDGVDDVVDQCSGTVVDVEVDANGCAIDQRGCAALADVRGNRFETEICALVDGGYWPVAPGSHAFAPDAPLPLQEEIVVPINIAGFGPLAQAEVAGICPGNPYFNFAINRRILKPSMPGCPSPLSEQGLYRPILEAARALMQMDKEHYNYFWMVASQYDGPSIGNLTTPHWIARDYYKYAYEMEALPDFDENRDPNDVMYGVQTVTRAQAAYIYYHMFHLDGLPERDVLPEAVALEDDAIGTLGFDAGFETDYPMKRGDFFGLALRLMKREGCVNYPDAIDNPFQDVPDDYEYVAELKKAVDMRLIKAGEGVSTTDPLGWKFNYTTYPTRRFESIVLSRLLSKVGACRTNCTTIYNREKNNIHFSPEDPTATTFASYAVCMVALDGFPMAEVDANGLVNTHFEGIPEAEESFMTLYNVLQVQP